MPAGHHQWKEKTPVTSPSRTLYDCSSVWTPKILEEAIIKALDSGLVTVAELVQINEMLRARGRRRVSVMDAVLATRSFDDTKMRSELQREARKLIGMAQLPLPEPEYAIALSKFTLHPDLAYPDAKLAIELDGYESQPYACGIQRRQKTRR